MTRAIVPVPALTAWQAGRPRLDRSRTAAVLISWRGGFGVPRYPAAIQAGAKPAARPAQAAAEDLAEAMAEDPARGCDG
jgi:hypothetical protein